MEVTSSRSWLPACLPALAAAACVLFGWTLWRGQDVNWDWENYHLYDAFALLHGRMQRDVAPAGPQSYLNPLPYLLPYAAQRLLPPLAAGLVVTATQLLPVMAAWAIAWRAWGEQPGRALAAGAACLCVCTGASMLTEVGTSFADVVLAAPPLLGMYLLLPGPGAGRRGRLLAAGIAVGVTVGIKPTTLFLLPALAAASAVAWPMRALMPVAGGAVLGGLLSDGLWAWILWRDFASPVFPFMNTIFRSPSAALLDVTDPRFHWQGVSHAIGLPWALAHGTGATGEQPVRDIRFILALPISLAVLAGRFLRRGAPDPMSVLAAWLLAGTAFWMLLSPIQRYAVSLEMVAAVLIVLVAARLAARATTGPLASAWGVRLATLSAAVLLLSASTQPADIFHRPWATPFIAHVPKGVPPGATYGLLTSPLAYWVVAQPRPDRAFNLFPTVLETGGVLQRRLDSMLTTIGTARDGGRLWLINRDSDIEPSVRFEMTVHHLALAPPCLRAASAYWIDTVFCRGIVAGPRAYGASDLRLDEAVRFGNPGDGVIYQIEGWNETEAGGVWAETHDVTLAFHPVAAGAGPVALTLTLSGVPGTPQHRVTARAGGGPAQTWLPGNDGKPYTVCIGPKREPGDVVLVHLGTDDIRSLSELGVSPEVRHLAFRLYGMVLQQAPPGAC